MIEKLQTKLYHPFSINLMQTQETILKVSSSLQFSIYYCYYFLINICCLIISSTTFPCMFYLVQLLWDLYSATFIFFVSFQYIVGVGIGSGRSGFGPKHQNRANPRVVINNLLKPIFESGSSGSVYSGWHSSGQRVDEDDEKISSKRKSRGTTYGPLLKYPMLVATTTRVEKQIWRLTPEMRRRKVQTNLQKVFTSHKLLMHF